MHVFQALLDRLRECFGAFPDKRTGKNTSFQMSDFGMAAFAPFFMQSSSFLAHQERLERTCGRSNCQSLFGMTRIPETTQVRKMLDAGSPALLYPVFGDIRKRLEQNPGALEPFRRLGMHMLIALDGTEYFESHDICCENCSTRTLKNGKVQYFHSMLGATLVAPGHDKVIPLEPEFITPQDGAEKQDCENTAAKRWLVAHGAQYASLNPIYLGDDLFSRQPLCEAVKAAGGNFIFVCKPSSHTLIGEYITGAELSTREVTIRRGKKRSVHRYRWLCDIPLRDGEDALEVNWFEIEIVDAKGKVTYRNSFITDLPVNAENVVELVECGRARWKIENETYNVLKQGGYNLDHNFGHGKHNLSSILVTLNLLAFAMHTLSDIMIEAWRRARQKHGSRARFFGDMTAITNYLIFPSWDDLLDTLAFVKEPPPPP
jgi:hypothetical protein